MKLSCDLYRDTEVAAIKAIRKLCDTHGFTVVRETPGGFEARCPERHAYVTASIRPRCESDGVWLTVSSRLGRRILDGQDYMFLHEDAQGVQNFLVYLASLDAEL